MLNPIFSVNGFKTVRHLLSITRDWSYWALVAYFDAEAAFRHSLKSRHFPGISPEGPRVRTPVCQSVTLNIYRSFSWQPSTKCPEKCPSEHMWKSPFGWFQGKYGNYGDGHLICGLASSGLADQLPSMPPIYTSVSCTCNSQVQWEETTHRFLRHKWSQLSPFADGESRRGCNETVRVAQVMTTAPGNRSAAVQGR